MPAHQQGFDGFPILAGAQFLVSQTALDIEGCAQIGVHAVTANLVSRFSIAARSLLTAVRSAFVAMFFSTASNRLLIGSVPAFTSSVTIALIFSNNSSLALDVPIVRTPTHQHA